MNFTNCKALYRIVLTLLFVVFSPSLRKPLYKDYARLCLDVQSSLIHDVRPQMHTMLIPQISPIPSEARHERQVLQVRMKSIWLFRFGASNVGLGCPCGCSHGLFRLRSSRFQRIATRRLIQLLHRRFPSPLHL